MKIALAHHWMTSYRGGERVLEQIATLAPKADIFTLVHDERVVIPGIAGRKVVTSELNSLPKIEKTYRHLLPAHPLAIKRMRVPDDLELLLSTDASLMKGITTSPETKHICYCHSPPRYLWEMADEYKKATWAARIALDRFAPMLRRFDFEAAQRVSHFIANSKFVAERIAKYYQRDAEVIYPPVAVDEFRSDRTRQSFYLVISELVEYKRIDLAVKAFNQLGKRLIVIGDGPQRKRLESIAKPNITFMGRQSFRTLKEHLETATAFVFPGIEDFGITPVEAQAAGCPVIALRRGGVLETVVEGQTGAFFDEQTSESLEAAVVGFEPNAFSPLSCAENAQMFSTQNFLSQYKALLRRVTGHPIVPAPLSGSILGHIPAVAN